MTFMAIIGYKLFVFYFPESSNETLFKYSFTKDLIYIIFSGLILKVILYQNETRNKSVFKKLKVTNIEIKESNERYDIVAKATSDTIWDWKIEEDSIIWNKGIYGVFGYQKEDVGSTSKWWFDRIHPEDSLKMSVKLYSFLEQKTENK